MPIRFTLYYNSGFPVGSESNPIGQSTSGQKWRHSFETCIIQDTTNKLLYLVWGTTGIEIYNDNSSGGRYTSNSPFNGNSLFSTNDGYKLVHKDQSQWLFNSAGLLTAILDKFGNRLTLNYNDTQLQSVILTGSADPVQFINFSYDGNGYLQTVSGSDNRSITLSVQNQTLQNVTTALGGTRQFNYADDGEYLLEQVIDEWGNTVVYNKYNNAGQVKKQYDGVGYSSDPKYFTRFAYGTTTYQGQNVNTTTVTTAENTTAVYYSDPDNQLILYQQTDISQGSAIDDLVDIVTTEYSGFLQPITAIRYQGSLAAYSNGKGNTTQYMYDSNLNLHSLTNPADVTRTWKYDEANNLINSSDDYDNQTSYTIIDGNRVQTITDAIGETVQFDYWAVSGQQPFYGLLKSSTDPYGNVTEYDYYANNGLLKTVSRPNGDVLAYTYDDSGRVQTVTESTNGVTQRLQTSSYDALNRLTQFAFQMSDQPTDQAFSYNYTYDDPVNNSIVVVDPSGNSKTVALNANRQPTTTTYQAFNGVTVTSTRQYDKNARLSGLLRGSNTPTQFAYNGLNQIIAITDPLGNTTTLSELQDATSGNGPFNINSSINYPSIVEDGQQYNYLETSSFDPSGRLQSIDRTYTQVGQNAALWAQQETYSYSTQAQNHGDRTSYNVQTTRSTTPLAPSGDAISEQQTVDGLYRPIQSIDARNKTTSVTYSSVPHPAEPDLILMNITTTPPAGATIQQYMDNQGRFIADILGSDQETRAVLRDLDVLNRPTRVRVGDTLDNLANGTLTALGAAQTDYTYNFDDSSGSAQLRIDTSQPTNDPNAVPVVALSTYYNGLNQLVGEDFFGATPRRFTYTPWGAVASRSIPNNQTAQFGFNAAGYLTSVSIPGETDTVISHTLDAAGNRTVTQLNGVDAVNRSFDAWNRLSTRTSDTTIGYSYWPNDRLRRLTYPDNKTVNYALDGLGNWETITDWANRQTSYSYLTTGQINSIQYPNGVTGTFNYNDAGAISGFNYTGPDNAVLANLTITPNSINEPQTVDGIWPAPPDLPADAVNLGITNNTVNSYQGTALSSGPDGSLTQIPDNSGNIIAIGYDGLGRVSSAADLSYGYDVDGLRTSVGDNSFTVSPNFYQDPLLNLGSPSRALQGGIAVKSGTAGWVFNAINGISNRANCLCMDLDWLLEAKSGANVTARYVHGIGPLIEEDSSGEARYFHSDYAGNIIALTDADGNITSRYLYSPYGAIRAAYGDNNSPFTFAGRFGAIDDGNGLIYMRARYHAPQLMRFTSIDQLVGNPLQPSSLNRFQYGLNRPNVYADPLGLSPLPWILGTAGVVAGGVALGAACYFFCGAAATAIGGLLGIGAAAGEIAADIEMVPLVGELGDELGGELGGELVGEELGGELVGEEVGGELVSEELVGEQSQLLSEESQTSNQVRWRGRGSDPRFSSQTTENTGIPETKKNV